MLLAETDEHRIRHRLYLIYRDAARADMPETTRLASTIETLVARRPHRPDDGGHRRPHRGLQPEDVKQSETRPVTRSV